MNDMQPKTIRDQFAMAVGIIEEMTGQIDHIETDGTGAKIVFRDMVEREKSDKK